MRHARIPGLPCAAALLMSMPALATASPHPYIVDGRIVLVEDKGSPPTRVPTPDGLVMLLAQAGDRLLLAAEPREVLPYTDEWAGFNLWIVDLAHLDVRPMTTSQETLGAVWSDRTQKICYWTRNMDLYLMDIDGGNLEQVAHRAATPAFSPDGTRLAYASLPADWIPGSLPGGFDLQVLDLRTRKISVLTSGYDDSDPVWSPSGTSILFRSGARTGLTSIWRVRVDGTGLEQLTNVGETLVTRDFVSNFASNRDVRWSTDGTMLVYGSREAENGEVWLLRFDMHETLRSATSLGEGLAPTWTGQHTILVARESPGQIHFAKLTSNGIEKGDIVSLEGRLTRKTDLSSRQPREIQTPHPDEEGQPIAVTASARYRLPLLFNPGYSGYYDNDSGGGILDWRCGSYTYNGHQGTDFAASGGSNILAGAGGNVSARNDGCDTVGYLGSTCGGGYGNYIKLDNSDGWYSYYAHMTLGTPTSASSVSCGNNLGLSGSSGNSSGYHLHFEVRKYGYPYDDPFAGACSGDESFWTFQRGGYPSRMCY